MKKKEPRRKVYWYLFPIEKKRGFGAKERETRSLTGVPVLKEEKAKIK